jgi:hypothetical protein
MSEAIIGKITRHSRIRKERVGMFVLGGFALSVWRRSVGTVRLNLADFLKLSTRIFPRSCRDLYVYLAQISRFLHLYEHIQHSIKNYTLSIYF